MGNGYLCGPEQNPRPSARQSAVCGEDLIYISICSGGVIIKMSAAERPNFVFRTTHYPWRCNLRCNFGRTDPLVKGSGGSRRRRCGAPPRDASTRCQPIFQHRRVKYPYLSGPLCELVHTALARLRVCPPGRRIMRN